MSQLAVVERVDTQASAPLEEQVRAELERRNLSQNKAAQEIGISATALSQYLDGKYLGDKSNVERRLNRWLEEYRQRENLNGGIRQAPRWVETPTGKRILNKLTQAHYTPTMTVIYGGAGLGKTSSIMRYKETNNNVWVVTATPASANISAFFEKISMVVGVKDVSYRSNSVARVEAAINRHLEGRAGLLIVDEAQALTEKALEGVRSIYDAHTKLGLALAGNDRVYSRMTGGSRTAVFAQLFSRIGVQMDLRTVTPGDVRALALAFGIAGDAEIEYLVKISAKPGALRDVALTVQFADKLAAGLGRAVTVKELSQAYKERGGAA
ncbi:MAG: AAA family ATPase [Nitrospinae bacterium]|nr:AAA family ATPase [Nitrospinota bacterium]